MILLLAPLAYLRLRSERGWTTLARDAIPVAFVAVILTLPFILVEGSIFFSKDGFLDKFSSFSGVLTGFYVAALIAIASVPSGKSDLDSVIEKGAVSLYSKATGKRRHLTRRQYVCIMFGYLSLLSVTIAILSIACVSISAGKMPWFSSVASRHAWDYAKTVLLIRALGTFVFAVPIAHMAITTLRGLYYLTDKIYVQSPKMLKMPDAD